MTRRGKQVGEIYDSQQKDAGTAKLRYLGALLIFLLLVVSVVASAASADNSEPASPPQLTPADIEEGVREGSSSEYQADLTDPEAAEELPHSDLSREQALDLMQSVFDPLLEAPAGVFDELHVERFLSDTAAILPAGEQLESPGTVIGAPPADRYKGPTLIESTLPLRTEGDNGSTEVVDLGLEHGAEELQPASPLVEVGIPDDLSEGISLPETGVQIHLEGAPEGRNPSTVDQSVAAYPEVATDTSLAVSPTPTGVETMTVLQSSDAPTSQTFHLDLPQGAELRPTEAGGAEVAKDGQSILGVAPPSALDAAEQEVPVSLSVSGDSLTLQVSPNAETSWPVLVDPVYETYNWWNGVTGLGGWGGWTNAAPNYYRADHNTCTTYASPYSCQAGETSNAPGLFIGALPGAVPAGSTVNWEFAVPRWSEEWEHHHRAPTDYISSLEFHGIGFWQRSDWAADPTLWMGLWNSENPGWIGGRSEGGNYPGSNGTGNLEVLAGENTGGKIASFSMVNPSGYGLTAFRDAFLNVALVSIADTKSPKFSYTSAPTHWVNQIPTEPITATVSDSGLGIYRISATPTGVLPKPQWPVKTNACTGTTISPCPGETTFNFSHTGEGAQEIRDYNPAIMPQGGDPVGLVAEDPLGNSASASVEVKVDHTPPSVTLSGSATEQAKLGTNLPQYTLKYSATDGDAAAPAAGTPFGTAGTAPGQMQEPKGMATDSSGNLLVVDRANERVMKYDSNGNFLMQFGSAGSGNGQFSDPRSIAVSSNGTIWVTDMGNNNVQAFDSNGQFLRKITNMSLSDPYGVAVDSGGNVWVSDITSDKLIEFSENGTLIRTAKGGTGPGGGGPAQMKSPTGLATDPAGNVWLVDYVENRVQKYNANGEFVMQFGSTGTGNGQLESPVAVAVAPSGNLLVTDSKSNRVQVFQPNGTYLRQFGSTGSGAGQFSTPVGIVMVAGNTAFVVDSGNHRVAKWTHADLDRQSGVVSTEIKVDGQRVEEPFAPGCPTENCAINNREWPLEASNYTAGQHTLEVVATDGVELHSPPKPLTFEVHPTPPSLALSGSITEQAALGNTRPRYTLQAEAGPNGQGGEVLNPTFLSAFGTAGSGTGQLNGPRGVASDGKGHVWIVDRANNRIEQFNEAGEYLGQFGSAGSGNGQFNNPWGIAVTPAGNLWVADTENQRVEEFNSKGEFMQKFGTKASGASKGTEFVLPEGIAVAPGGMIWVTDYSGNRIAEFRETVSSESERLVRNATGATIEQPRGVALDGSGNVWVANVGSNQLLEFSPEGSFIRSAGSSGSGNGQLSNPGGLSIDSSGRIYVVDQNNSRVQVLNSKGEFLQKFGTAGTGNGNFSEPKAIALGAAGAIFVTDKGNNRVHKWGQGPPSESPPTFLSAFGTAGSGTGQLNGPRGVASDGKGHVWIVDRANNRIEQFNEAGEYLGQFGSAGSGNGQFNNPWGIAVTPAGNLWVADTENQRVEEFNSKGEFMQKFGTKASGASKGTEFVLPEGIAVAPGGMIWVTDYSGNRIAEFRETVSSESERLVRNATGATIEQPRGVALDGSGNVWVANVGSNQLLEFSPEGSFIRSAGSSGSGNGQLSNPGGLSIDSSGRIYVVDQNNSRVQVLNSKGEFLQKFGTAGTGNGNFSEPKAIALGAAGAIFVTDKGNNRVHKWQQALPLDPVASIEVKVDGKAVSTTPLGCAGSNCTLAKEWVLKSAEYLGSHSVVVKATTASGWSTTKTLTVEAHPDATAPTLESGGALIEAPQGWVEQKAYGLTATAKDTGYGATSLAFKIDGLQVASTNQACADGGCPETLAKSVNMGSYSGGAHAAELIATDGAGNVAKKAWTINVDPKGAVSAEEAAETLEAVDETSESGIVASNDELLDPEQIQHGDDPQLVIDGQKIESTGVPDVTQLTTTLSEGVTISGPENQLTVTPIADPKASPTQISGGVAGVTANSAAEADTIIRPEYDGMQAFQAIRSVQSPQDYSWAVKLSGSQHLVAVNASTAEVVYASGLISFLIVAEEAHDATGKAVPTSLSVEGNILTLHVMHRNQSVTYPVTAGQSFETGYETTVYSETSPEEEGSELQPPSDITEALAKQIVRAEPRSPVVVPPPSPCGGEACDSKVTYFEVKARVCSGLGCGVYWYKLTHADIYRNNVGVTWGNEPLVCEYHISSGWTLEVTINIESCGFHAPYVVVRGSGETLIAFSHFEVEMSPLAQLWSRTSFPSIIDKVYPNGFQETVEHERDHGNEPVDEA